MFSFQLISLISLFIVSIFHSTPEKTILPDYPKNISLYSGYLDAGNNTSFFYIYTEPLNKTEKEDQPLLLWLEGGPGCSSLIGLFQEIGPQIFNFQAQEMQENNFTWSKNSHILYLESPSGVGFNDPSETITTDDSSADQNLNSLISFFKKFPELKKKKLYIGGESYSGVYIPYLAEKIINYNSANSQSEKINLQGILVGNGVTDGYAEFVKYFAVSRDLLSHEIIKMYYDCKSNRSNCNETEIFESILQIYEKGNGSINPYNIYGKCAPNSPVECLDFSGITYYLNRPDVQKALKLSKKIDWISCGNINYQPEFTSIEKYPKLIENKLKILIFSGDTDGTVPTPYTRDWLRKLNLTAKQDRNWKTWNVDEDYLAGFVTEYEEGIIFATIHGAGHFATMFKRKASLYLYEKFISGNQI